MGRPSIRQKRKEQILDAYERCVIRYGIEGATLQKIADEAGIARPLVRHHIGNRDALKSALLERYLSWSRKSLTGILEALPDEKQAFALIDNFFFDSRSDTTEYVLLWEALAAGARNDEELAKFMTRWVVEFIQSVKEVVAAQYPEVETEAANEVATGVTSIYFNAESVSVLGPMPEFRMASYNAARKLIETLEPPVAAKEC